MGCRSQADSEQVNLEDLGSFRGTLEEEGHRKGRGDGIEGVGACRSQVFTLSMKNHCVLDLRLKVTGVTCGRTSGVFAAWCGQSATAV